MKPKYLIIVGNGGHYKVVNSLIKVNEYRRVFHIKKFHYSQDKFFQKKQLNRINKIFNKFNDGMFYFFIAIGFNYDRKLIVEILKKNIKHKFSFATIISDSANIHINTKIGEGTVIMPGVTINIGSIIRSHSIINTNSSLDHDNIIGNYSSLGPGTITGGNVKIGSCTHIGIGSSIKHNISIKNNVVIGGGSFVNKSCKSNSMYFGVPINFIKKRKSYDQFL